MSSAVVSTSAALGRPFLFDDEPEVPVLAGKKPSGQSSTTQVIDSIINKQQSTIISLGNRHSAIENAILPASHLEIRPAPEMATSGIPALDALTGGLPRGCLTEIYGPASSGRTSVMLAALAAATRRGEYCALIDASDALDPYSLAAAGVDIDRLLWVRCTENSPQRHPSTSLRAGSETETTNRGKEFIANKSLGQPTVGAGKVGKGTALAVPYRNSSDSALAAEGRRFHSQDRKHSEHRLEQVLRATDLLLESGGFGLILLDLADVPYMAARRIPLTTWFRFRRAVEHKPTILLAIEQQPIAGSCSSLQLQLQVPSFQFSVLSSNQFSEDRGTLHRKPAHAHLFTELKIHAELIRSRLDRKPARSIAFETKTAWAG